MGATVGKIALGLGGSLLGGLSKSGNQGSQKTTINSTNTQTGNSFEEQNTNQLTHAIEQPYFADFRKAMVEGFGKEYQKAAAPVYGEAQIADFMGQADQLGKTAMDNLRSTLAAGGRLNSGSFDTGATNILRDIMGKKTSFLSQLPFQEAAAHNERIKPFMQIGAGWAGAAPVDVQQTGQATDARNFSTSSITNGMQDTVMQGAPWWKGVLGGVGGMMGAGSFGIGPFGNMSSWGWGKKSPLDKGIY